ncbi:hypothetical protein Sste5346_008258 [Sporothrix stenoceras]|uniref:Glycosyl transferase CAP10 domain-containing protein n=1 Tax=Sporothrix stenoceras TaxID=5173 RepID=A0ABR3YQ43_9PEZI
MPSFFNIPLPGVAFPVNLRPDWRQKLRGYLWWARYYTLPVTVWLTIVYAIMLAVQPEFLPIPLRIGDPDKHFTVKTPHPITSLIEKHEAQWEQIMSHGQKSVHEAAEAYRERRGHHPPPHFDEWAKAALKENSVIVESFFDRIYHDLKPLWSISATNITFTTISQPNVIRIRGGKVAHFTNGTGNTKWVKTYADFIGEFSDKLPDMDIPINVMDTPRLTVSKTDIDDCYSYQSEQMNLDLSLDDAVTVYSRLDTNLTVKPHEIMFTYNHDWHTDGLAADPAAYWLMYRQTCLSKSYDGGPPPHEVELSMESSIRGSFPNHTSPAFSSGGYISNVTLARDPCAQLHIRALHGIFLKTTGFSTSTSLTPIFSGSKLPGNNDILLPSAIYLSQKEPAFVNKFKDLPWDERADGLYWRGKAPAGDVVEDGNWWRFQRYRFVQMADGDRARAYYNDGRADDVNLHRFSVDLDTGMHSSRWPHLLRSKTMPIKATIFVEWHDARLQPWVHYVPMDNTFMDIYGILDYFTVPWSGKHKTYEKAGKKIAKAGTEWAKKWLRREDMKLYTWRLLLEFARLHHDNRSKMAYVDDLIDKNKRDLE